MGQTTLVVLLALAPACALGAASPPREKDMRGLYSRDVLRQWKMIFEPQLRDLYDAEIRQVIKGTENVDLSFELEPYNGWLLNFRADEQSRAVIIPILATKFVYDVIFATQWLRMHGRSDTDAMLYVSMLKYKDASAWPGRKYPTPFAALGMPFKDTDVPKFEDPLEQHGFEMTFRGAMLFILAHETSHALGLTHSNDAVLSEMMADQDACLIFARNQEAAGGVHLFFQIASQWLPNSSDFPTTKDFVDYIASAAADHPVSGDRVTAVGDELARVPEKYFPEVPKNDQRIQMTLLLAEKLHTLGNLLDDLALNPGHRPVALDTDPDEIDGTDLVKLSAGWWGIPIARFTKAAGLKAGQFKIEEDPLEPGGKRLRPGPGIRWSPPSLYPEAVTFSPSGGLTSIFGSLPKHAAFDAVASRLAIRYATSRDGKGVVNGDDARWWDVGPSRLILSRNGQSFIIAPTPK